MERRTGLEVPEPDPSQELAGWKIYFAAPRPSQVPPLSVASFSYRTGGPLVLRSRRETLVSGQQGGFGMAFNPQREDALFLDRRDGVQVVHIETGLLQEQNAGGSVKRMEVIDPHVLATTSDGPVHVFPINNDGSLGEAIRVSISGDAQNLTQIIATPGGLYFTQATGVNLGRIGRLTFSPNFTGATTEVYYTNVPAARGGVYDPYTRSIILMGLSHVTQVPADLGPPAQPGDPIPIISDRDLSGFDGIVPELYQGTVDGRGRLFVTSPRHSRLFLLDFTRTRLVGHARTHVTAAEISNVHDVQVRRDRVTIVLDEGAS